MFFLVVLMDDYGLVESLKKLELHQVGYLSSWNPPHSCSWYMYILCVYNKLVHIYIFCHMDDMFFYYLQYLYLCLVCMN